MSVLYRNSLPTVILSAISIKGDRLPLERLDTLKKIYCIPMDNHSVSLLQRISIDPNICHGQPCIRGLRYPVTFVLELLSSGMTPAEILEDYQDLEEPDIFAVLLYAAQLSQVKTITRLAS